MAYRCAVCGKGAQAAHNVSHSNLQRVHVVIDGTPQHVRACTRCIRSGKITKAA